MKNKIIFSAVFVLIFTFSIFAQDTILETPVCEHPFSTKFDEFEFTDLQTVKERLDLFGLQIKNLNARGFIIGYGGKITEASQGYKISYRIEEYLLEKFGFFKNKSLFVIDGGHREKPSVELYIKHQSCSTAPKSSPTLSYDEVTFKEEESFFDKTIVRKTVDELENLLTHKVEPVYPAAAKAVGACGKVLVFIIIDEKGNVINARAIAGHPLLRAASEAIIRQWKYKTVQKDDTAVKFGGKVIIDWDPIADKWNSEYKIANN